VLGSGGIAEPLIHGSLMDLLEGERVSSKAIGRCFLEEEMSKEVLLELFINSACLWIRLLRHFMPLASLRL